MSDPRPGYDPTEDPAERKRYYGAKFAEVNKKKKMAKKMTLGSLAKRFAKHADTYDRVGKNIKADIKKRGGKLPF